MIDIVHIKLLVGFFLMGHLLLISLVVSMRIIKVLTKKRNRKVTRHIRKLLAYAVTDNLDMLSDERGKKTMSLLRGYLKKTRYRRVILQELRHASLLISGNSFMVLQKLYLEFDLHTFSLKKLKGRSVKGKIQAIKEISQLKYMFYNDEIASYIHHPNDQLRAEAIIALIGLSRDPLFYLKDRDVTITEWETVRILNKLESLDWKKVPNFSQWFNHPQPSIVIFCLRMTAHFRQWTSLPYVHELTLSYWPEIRVEAHHTLKILGNDEASQESESISLTTEYYAHG